MKILFLFTWVFLSALAWANSTLDEKIKFELNARTIDQLIQPKKIKDKIYTPYAAWYIQGKDIAPSCALIDKNNLKNKLEMMAPSEGQFSNCHQAIKEPVVSFINGNYYATYELVIEDTRAAFSAKYQVVKLTENGFFPCKEDEDNEISNEINKNVKLKKMALNTAVAKTINKFGCTEAPQSDNE